MSNETFDAPEVNDPEGAEFTPDLQEQVGDGADEQPGADGAPLSENYDHNPEADDDASDDDAEGEGVGDQEDEPA
jgi:hypothetical protein